MPLRPVLPVEVAASFGESRTRVELLRSVVRGGYQQPVSGQLAGRAFLKEGLHDPSAMAAEPDLRARGHAVQPAQQCASPTTSSPMPAGSAGGRARRPAAAGTPSTDLTSAYIDGQPNGTLRAVASSEGPPRPSTLHQRSSHPVEGSAEISTGGSGTFGCGAARPGPAPSAATACHITIVSDCRVKPSSSRTAFRAAQRGSSNTWKISGSRRSRYQSLAARSAARFAGPDRVGALRHAGRRTQDPPVGFRTVRSRPGGVHQRLHVVQRRGAHGEPPFRCERLPGCELVQFSFPGSLSNAGALVTRLSWALPL